MTSPSQEKSARPAEIRRTMNANTTCRLSPHSTVFPRIARRLVEKRYASPTIVAMPRIPSESPQSVPPS